MEIDTRSLLCIITAIQFPTDCHVGPLLSLELAQINNVIPAVEYFSKWRS